MVVPAGIIWRPQHWLQVSQKSYSLIPNYQNINDCYSLLRNVRHDLDTSTDHKEELWAEDWDNRDETPGDSSRTEWERLHDSFYNTLHQKMYTTHQTNSFS